MSAGVQWVSLPGSAAPLLVPADPISAGMLLALLESHVNAARRNGATSPWAETARQGRELITAALRAHNGSAPGTAPVPGLGSRGSAGPRLTTKQVATAVGVDERAVRKRCSKGLMGQQHEGGAWAITEAEIAAWQDERSKRGGRTA